MKDDKLLVNLNGKLFQIAGAEKLIARPPKYVRKQVVSTRLTCIDKLSEWLGCATYSEWLMQVAGLL